MAAEEEYRRIFRGLRGRGELNAVLDVVRDLHKITEGHLRAALGKKIIRKPEDLAAFQVQQGELKAYLTVLRAFDGYAKPESERKPTRRPDPGEAAP